MTTKKMILMESLENLSKEDFKKFCSALVDRGGERKVPKPRVEDQPRLEVTNALVSTFTEAEAPAVVSKLLEGIGCIDEATKLDAQIAEIDKKSLNASPKQMSGKHFVDKHKLQLIKRVTNIDPILDGLLYKRVLQDGAYNTIRLMSGKEDKMRKIYDIALKSGGDAKNVFMELLRKHESYLVEDLLLKDP